MSAVAHPRCANLACESDEGQLELLNTGRRQERTGAVGVSYEGVDRRLDILIRRRQELLDFVRVALICALRVIGDGHIAAQLVEGVGTGDGVALRRDLVGEAEDWSSDLRVVSMGQHSSRDGGKCLSARCISRSTPQRQGSEHSGSPQSLHGAISIVSRAVSAHTTSAGDTQPRCKALCVLDVSIVGRGEEQTHWA